MPKIDIYKKIKEGTQVAKYIPAAFMEKILPKNFDYSKLQTKLSPEETKKRKDILEQNKKSEQKYNLMKYIEKKIKESDKKRSESKK